MNEYCILVVEDESIVAKDIQMRLRDLGYTVPAIAHTGQDAIRLAGEVLPDLILMDIRINGDMDGIETATAIRKQQDIPVIYLTAYSDERTLERAAATSPMGYLVKPFQDRDLKITIEMALYRSQTERHTAQLTATNDQLEHRVLERTRDLQSANDRLTHEVEIRKLAEEDRKKLNQKLESKNKELEEIVYVTSHDLRSPLVNVQGFSKELDLSLQELGDILNNEALPPAVRQQMAPIIENDIPDALCYIQSSVARMDSLLAGLLRLSRLGQAALNIVELNMDDLLLSIENDFEFRIDQEGVRLHIDSLPSCQGDTMLVNMIFSNLIDNAIKYRDPSRPCEIRVYAEEVPGKVRYTVEDNGIGIPETKQSEVFEIFRRLNPKDTVGGEGLGLTIIKKNLDRIEGEVFVESEFGKGSRFIISLPATGSLAMALSQ